MIDHETPGVSLPGLIRQLKDQARNAERLGNDFQRVMFEVCVNSPLNEHEPYALELEIVVSRKDPGVAPRRLWFNISSEVLYRPNEDEVEWQAVTSIRDCWYPDYSDNLSGGGGSGGSVNPKALPYDIQFSFEDPCVNEQRAFVAPRDLALDNGVTAYVQIAPVVDVDFEVYVNATKVGSIRVFAGSGSAQASIAATSLASGGVLKLVCVTNDTTIAGVLFNVATKVT